MNTFALMKNYLKPVSYPGSAFLIILIALYLFIGFHKYVTHRPESVHMWAQCDRASIARNYAEESMNFFLPRIHETRDLDGITGLEFPIVNYLAAVCYKLFGFHEFWYRFIMLLFMTAGLIAAFRTAYLQLQNFYLALCASLLFFLSPVLDYYTPSFIPDTASLGLILVAWYSFFKAAISNNKKYFWLLVISSALACLIKITSLISVVVMIVLVLADSLKILSKEKKSILSGKGYTLGSAAITILAVISWYKYAAWLSLHHNSGVFLMQANTPHSWAEVRIVWKQIKEMWLPFYYSNAMYTLIVASWVILIICFKKVNRLLGLITLGLWLGNICFLSIMFNQFREHDYYIITLLPALFFQFTTFADLMRKIVVRQKIQIAAWVITVALLLFQANTVRRHLAFRYDKASWIYYGNQISHYYTVEPYLRSLNIKRDDKVIHIGDDSPNITLYLMNVKGWSDKNGSSDEEIIGHIKSGAKYLVTGDTAQSSRPALQSYLETQIGKYGNIEIYKLRR